MSQTFREAASEYLGIPIPGNPADRPIYVTKSGRMLTADDIEALVAESEHRPKHEG